jgi:hypothetical protein
MLVEWLVYSMVLSFFSLITMHWIVTDQSQRAAAQRQQEAFLSLVTAQDVLVRDLRRVAGDAVIVRQGDSSYVWPQEGETVGFQLKNGGLYRMQGVFDVVQGWGRATTSLVAEEIEGFGIAYDTTTRALVTCWIENADKVRLERSVMLLGGGDHART